MDVPVNSVGNEVAIADDIIDINGAIIDQNIPLNNVLLLIIKIVTTISI